MTATFTHGTLSSYINRRCRCDPCREASAAYRRAWKARKVPAKQVPHGTTNGYDNYLCRCDECRAASAAYKRAYRARRRRADA